MYTQSHTRFQRAQVHVRRVAAQFVRFQVQEYAFRFTHLTVAKIKPQQVLQHKHTYVNVFAFFCSLKSAEETMTVHCTSELSIDIQTGWLALSQMIAGGHKCINNAPPLTNCSKFGQVAYATVFFLRLRVLLEAYFSVSVQFGCTSVLCLILIELNNFQFLFCFATWGATLFVVFKLNALCQRLGSFLELKLYWNALRIKLRWVVVCVRRKNVWIFRFFWLFSCFWGAWCCW